MRKDIVFNSKNNSNSVFTEVSKREYIHIFMSPGIAISRGLRYTIIIDLINKTLKLHLT